MARNIVMAAPYIPNKDADLGPFLLNLATVVTANPTDFGLTAPVAVILTAQSAAWAAAYALATDPGTRTGPTIAAKDATRASVVGTVRPYCVQISQNPAVTDDNKALAGVTIRKIIPTPVPAPLDRPAITVTNNVGGRVTFATSNADAPVGKSKPFGAIGVQVYTVVGTTPAVDPNQTSYNQQWTKSPNWLEFTGADRGKTLSLYARYVTRGGPNGVAQTGPWSDLLTVVIT